MDKRTVALILIFVGFSVTILISFGLVDEMRRTDIVEAQKVYGAWIFMVIISIAPFVAGLHFLVPKTFRSHPN